MPTCCCCTDAPSLADDPRLVYLIYVIAFIPLAFIYALDFITDKWRTIRDTRRNGMVQLFVSLPSLACVVFYIHLQMKNRDHKEAAAAIVVAVFNSYHVLRTTWGLILLYEFRNWNICALRCLITLGYKAPRYGFSCGVNETLLKLKKYPSQWKSCLVRVVESLKTKFVPVCNWSLPWMQPASPSTTDIQSRSSHSVPIVDATEEKYSSPTHQSKSCFLAPDSTSDGSVSSLLSEQNSFRSTHSDLAVIESGTPLFRVKKSCSNVYSWTKRTMEGCDIYCMKENIKNIYSWAMGNMEERESCDYLSVEEIKRTIDHRMVVNSSLLDNEFSNVELPMRPTIFSRVIPSNTERHSVMARFFASCLKSGKPEECSVRWLVSFLAMFGYEWLVDTKGINWEDWTSLPEHQSSKRTISLVLGLIASAHVTEGSVDDNGSTEKFLSLRSPGNDVVIGLEPFLFGRVPITEKCMLPFKMLGNSGTDLYFSSLEATIRDAVRDDWHKTSLNKLDDDQRSAVENITSIQLSYFSTLMESCLEVSDQRDVDLHISFDRTHPCIGNLTYQFGVDPGDDHKTLIQHLPIQKWVWSTVLWYTSPSDLLLQASVHIDNCLSLICDPELYEYVDEVEKAFKSRDCEVTKSVFENQYGLELRLLRVILAKEAQDFPTARFIGCVGETVRSTLASWVAQNDAETVGWNASIAPVGIRFSCSKQLCSALSAVDKKRTSVRRMQSLSMRLVAEAQAHLQWVVENVVLRIPEDIRQSPFLIMLYILGFPSLKVETTGNAEIVYGAIRGAQTIEFEDSITITPVGGPQEVRLILTCDQESGKMSVVFRPESYVFKWQEWKDAFMGRLAAKKHWRMTRLSSDNELLRTEAKESSICSPVEYIGSETLGKDQGVRYWSGWPPFMLEIAQFEIRSLMEDEAGPPLPKPAQKSLLNASKL